MPNKNDGERIMTPLTTAMPHGFWANDFRKQFDGDLHQVVLIFRGIVRSVKGLAEMTATDRLA
jgi:hypothetical protein